MAPIIYIFVGPVSTQLDADIIHNLERQGYAPLVDKIHQSDYYWFKNNFLYEHRFYTISNDSIYDYTIENLDQEMDVKPKIAVAFDEDKKMYSENWSTIMDFLYYSIFGKDMKESDLELTRAILPIPVKEVCSTEEDTVMVELPDCYAIETKLVEEYDTMLYQVTKPNTDQPYTTLTKQFSKRGHEPFFTSLFICQSWGVCRQDISFLAHVWKEWNMEGEFDLDRLLKERTERCYPGKDQVPEPEPVVYRRSLQHVLEILERKKNGFLINK